MGRIHAKPFGRSRRGSFGIALLCAVAIAGCGSSSESDSGNPGDTATADAEGLTYVALGDSWPEGAHCNGCRTFPQTHAETLSQARGEPVTLHNLSGQAQPNFASPGGGGSAGLLKALRSDDAFRNEVAAGDIIVISTGPNDGSKVFQAIERGECGGANDTACVATLGRRWNRDFDAILGEIEALRAGRPTAVRLVNAANAFLDPATKPESRRGYAAYFAALTRGMCDNAKKHGVVCVDVRPVLNGPGFAQPVDDSSQESMDAVAELLARTGVPELE